MPTLEAGPRPDIPEHLKQPSGENGVAKKNGRPKIPEARGPEPVATEPLVTTEEAHEVTETEQPEISAEVKQLEQQLQQELNAAGEQQWSVQATLTENGYDIGIEDVDKPGRWLDLNSLLKYPGVQETYTKLIGALELDAMKRLGREPGKVERDALVYSERGQVKMFLGKAERKFLGKLWGKAETTQEPPEQTEQKESKLAAIFERGRSALGGFMKGIGERFSKIKAALTKEAAATSPQAEQVVKSTFQKKLEKIADMSSGERGERVRQLDAEIDRVEADLQEAQG
ncbi:hypothetical protein HY374_03485, partial [Candidatus Berkelbacteria bacterium]|nr:hypothetical protein [Candidatus Berkelbacteria bacterium]